jgi:predicted NUDIX family phosphoesterase
MEKVMAVKRDVLLKKSFQGFVDKNAMDYQKIILDNHVFMNRFDIENDPEYKQPIPYGIIVNRKTKKVLVCRRSSVSKDNPDKRLFGKSCIGIGGHVNPSDSGKGNPIENALIREVEEEVSFEGETKPELFGYVNYDGDSVGMHHFGIVYLINMDSGNISIKSPELVECKLISLKEFEEIPESEIERWSVLVYERLKCLLSKH